MLDKLLEVLQLHKKIFRPPGTQKSFKKSWKIFRSLTDFVDLLQLHNSYLGTTGTLLSLSKNLSKYLEALETL